MTYSVKLLSQTGLILCLLLLQAAPVSSNNQSALMSKLFDSYEASVRPICGTNDPIEVQISLAVRQIIELDEPKQILYLNAWLRINWFDCQLQWDPVDYANISNLIFPYDKVWAPDITLYDNAEGTMPGVKDYRINAHSNGKMYYNFPTIISVLCKMDVTYFPFDTQRCALMFGSWAYHGYELNVTNLAAAGDISNFVTNTEFTITSMPLERHIVLYTCCPEPYPDVTFYMYLKRKPMFYVLNLLFPCILITSVALLGFLLPPDAGEKVSLEITVLLSLAVFLLVVSETLPPTSETFPYIGIFFAVAMMLVSLSTVLTVLVLNVHHKEYKPLPKWMKIVFLRYAARVVFFSDDTTAKHWKGQVQHCGTTGDRSHQNGGLSLKHENGHVNSAIQNFQINESFNKDELSEIDDTIFEDLDEPKVELTSGLGPITRPPTALGEETYTPVEPNGQFTPLIEVLNAQLRVMKKMEARRDEKHRQDHQCNEWRVVAIILDRIFLILFTFITVLTSLIILVPLSDQD